MMHWSWLPVVLGVHLHLLSTQGVFLLSSGVSSCCAGNLQPWSWVLSKSATFGWLFNARAASFEQNTGICLYNEAVDLRVNEPNLA